MSRTTSTIQANASVSRNLDASLRDGAEREINAMRVDLRERVLARIEGAASPIDLQRDNAADPGAGHSSFPFSAWFGPFALAACIAIIAGVAIRASFLATRAPAPNSDVGAYLARSLSSVEQLVAEQAPRQALAAVERFIEQPLRDEARALLTGAQRALADFSAQSKPLRTLPPLPAKP